MKIPIKVSTVIVVLLLILNISLVESQIAHCQYVDDWDPTFCYYCDDGYELNSDYSQCIIGNCQTLNSNTSLCDKCYDGYDLNSNKTACTIPHCQMMDSWDPSYCYQCQSGYMDDGSGRNCVSSDNGCSYGYEMYYGYCVLSDYNTVLYYDGYYIQCDYSCLNCDAGGKCLTCLPGYALDSNTNQCAYCYGCKSCNASAPQNCTDCFSPQTLNTKTKQCVDPTCQDVNCVFCGYGGNCLWCAIGYFWNGTSCLPCKVKGCIYCDSSIDLCDVCNEGYIFYSNTKQCLSCPAYCKTCLISDISQCTSCNSGLYLSTVNGMSTCLPCATNCADCSSAAICNQCADGYNLTSDKSSCSIICDNSCAACSSTDPSTCTACYAGSQLNTTDSSCVPSLTCNNTKTCYGCPPGYTIYQSQCLKCDLTDNNCVNCPYNSLSTCTGCKKGYYLNGTSCVTCPGNCSSCIGTGQCLICNAGYWLQKSHSSQTGTCSACNTPCKTCNLLPDTCTSCIDQYFLNGTSCISNYFVQLQITFAADIAQAFDIIGPYYNWLLNISNQAVGGQLNYTQKDITLISVEKGSQIQRQSISTKTENNTKSVANALSQALNSGSTAGGYAITGKVTTNLGSSGTNSSGSGSNTTTSSSSPSSSSISTGAIIGIIIGGIAGVIILGIILFCLIRRNLKKPKDQQQKIPDKSNSATNIHTNNSL